MSATYNTKLFGDRVDPDDWEAIHGDGNYCLQVESVGTGIFLVRRRALEKISQKSKVEKVRSDEMFETVIGSPFYYNFFDH